MNKTKSVILSLVAYLVALFAAAAVFNQITYGSLLVKLAMADATATVVVFLFSVVFNNSSMYDPYWSVKPFVFALFYLLRIPLAEISAVQILTFIFVFLYAFRLTANFYRGWPGLSHEDWRYRNFREQFPKLYWVVSFLGIHLFPTVMVYLGCLPMWVIFNEPVVIPVLAWAGLLILLFSVVLAFVADEQLRVFRSDPAASGKTISHGLWAWSRHPNYLGEMLTWWGLFFIALASGMDALWTGTGALAISLMFVFISIPMMEKHTLKRRNDYAAYKKSVPFLIPFRSGKRER